VLQVEGRLSQGSCSRRHATLVMNLQSSILMAQTTCMPHCLAHGGGRRCQKEGCSKSVAHAPGSVFCTPCLRGTLPQPDGAQPQVRSCLPLL
jgi:hypothetical protein